MRGPVHCGKCGELFHVLDVRAWSQMPAPERKGTLEAIAASDDVVERMRLHTRTGWPLGDDY